LGPGEQDLKLEGVIYASHPGSTSQISRMKETAEKGEPLMLVDGLGNVLGKWVITRFEERQTTFYSNGLPRKVEFLLELKKFKDRQSHILTEIFR
jgi:phage protein U